MTRMSKRRYQWQVMLATTVYTAVLLLVWPLVGKVAGLLPKVMLALTPVLPMLYMIALFARRIRDSDELEQRTHLIALGTATVVVGALSLVGAFLAIAKVLVLDGTVLIWVFPTLMVCYGATRWWVARSYGMGVSCGDEDGLPLFVNFLLAGALMAAVALYARLTHDAQAFGMFCGMASAFVLLAAVHWLRRRHARLRREEGAES